MIVLEPKWPNDPHVLPAVSCHINIVLLLSILFDFDFGYDFVFNSLRLGSNRCDTIRYDRNVMSSFTAPPPPPAISLCWLIKTNRNEGKTWFLCFLFCFVRFCYLLFCFKHKNRYVKVYAMKLCHFPFSRGAFLRPKTFWHELSPSSSSSS